MLGAEQGDGAFAIWRESDLAMGNADHQLLLPTAHIESRAHHPYARLAGLHVEGAFLVGGHFDVQLAFVQMQHPLMGAEVHADMGVGIHIQGTAIWQIQSAHALGMGGNLVVIQLARCADRGRQHGAEQSSRHRQGRAPKAGLALGQCQRFVQLLQLGEVGPQLFEFGIGARMRGHRLPVGKGFTVGAACFVAVACKPTGGLGVDAIARLAVQRVCVARAVHSGCSVPGAG